MQRFDIVCYIEPCKKYEIHCTSDHFTGDIELHVAVQGIDYV